MIQEEWKSQSKQMETVIAMSQEGMEWCISIAEEEDNQECGDVTYLTTVDIHRVSISTWAQQQMVFNTTGNIKAFSCTTDTPDIL